MNRLFWMIGILVMFEGAMSAHAEEAAIAPSDLDMAVATTNSGSGVNTTSASEHSDKQADKKAPRRHHQIPRLHR